MRSTRPMSIAIAISFALIASCEKSPVETASRAVVQLDSAQILPKADPISAYFMWTPDEQLIGYRNIDKIFDTRLVRAGPNTRPLAKSESPLSVSFEFEGEELTEATFMERNNVVGLLVIKDGEIVMEHYRQHYDDEQRWISFSMAKSFSTTLVGAAIKDGAIESVDDLLTDYLPALAGTAYDGITIEQLLTMTTGAAWNEDYADPESDVARIKLEPSIDGSDPVVAYMARKPREVPPGTRFQYNTGETHLVGSLLYAATGMNLADYLSEKVWIPYGMELDANWMVNNGGIEQAGCCLSVSLRDFGRFAMFFMNGAKIDGVSIVPEHWIATATTPTRVSQESEMMKNRSGIDGYGYMWWITDGPAYRAIGIFGQLIHINPALNLIIVTQSAWPTALASTERSRTEAFTTAIEAAVVK